MFGKLKTKSDFFAGKMLLCDMPFSSIFLLNNHERSGSWPNMFFVVVGTQTKCVINEFALDARIDILIFQCHTVTNGIDLRRSPLVLSLKFEFCTKFYIRASLIIAFESHISCRFQVLKLNFASISRSFHKTSFNLQNGCG